MSLVESKVYLWIINKIINLKNMLLKIGSRGQQVKDLQEFLGADADGIFGKGTEAAVKEWQTANGLEC